MSLLGYSCGLNHGVDLLTIDLNGSRTLGRSYGQLAHGAADAAHKGIGRHELSVDHIGTLLTANLPERLVGDIFHRGEHHRFLAKVNIPYPHSWLLCVFVIVEIKAVQN